MAGVDAPLGSMDDEASQAAVLADAMTDAMVVAERNSLDDQPGVHLDASTSSVHPLGSRAARRAKERLEESRDRLRRVIEGEWDLKTTLAHRERKAVAGALACVTPGLDAHDDDDVNAFTSDLLRWFVTDALGLDEDSLLAVAPLAHPPPASVDAQNQRTSNASSTFVGSLAVADALPGDDEPDSEIQPTNDASDTSTRYTDTNSEAGRLRERWTDVIGALMTAAVAAKRYDARCAAALRRLASSAGVRWSRIAALEDSLALHLKSILRSQRGADPGADPGADLGADTSSPSMSPSTNKPQTSAPHEEGSVVGWISGTFRNMSASRALSVTAAAAVGGGVLFVTGGLAAPAVVASLASMGAAGGILGTAALSMGTLLAYFGGAGGISMIFGGVGAGLTGWRMLNRTSGLSQFAFLPVRGTGAGMSVYLFVPGFLRDPADLFRTWGATDGVYSVMLKLPKRSDVKGHLDDDDDVKGSLVAGLGMWLKRDVDTREVFVSWIDPGGVADRAGVAEGSVLTALATRVDAPDSPDDPSDTDTSRQHAPIVRRVRGGGDDSNDTTALSLSQVRAVLAGKDRTRSGEKLSEISDEMSGSGDGVVVAELWLRRNLAAGDDVEKIAKRRGLPKLKLFRRKAELKRKAKLAEAMVGASQAPAATAGEVEDAEDDVKEDVDNDDEDDEDDEDDDDNDDNDDTDDDTEAPKEDTKALSKASSSPPSSPSVQHKWHRAGIDALRSIGHGVASVASIVPFVGSAHTPIEGRTEDDAADASTDSNDAGPGKKPGDEKKSSAAAAAKLAESWPLPNGEQHVVGWEHALLIELGLAMTSFAQDAAVGYAVGHGIGYTSLAGIAAAVTWPALLLKSSQFIDSPWALAEARADDAGDALARALLDRRQGTRPVTLIGYSIGTFLFVTVFLAIGVLTFSVLCTGCVAIRRCCAVLEAAEGGAGRGLIDGVVLVGATLDCGHDTWAPIRAVSCGRVVNAHVSGAAASNDWLLAFLYRANTQVLSSVFNPTNVVGAAKGLAAWCVVSHPGVENVDVSDVCSQHTDIPDEMPRILTKCGVS